MTLRAIGNIEQTQTMIPVLEKCFSRKNNAMGIRVAAVEAYRRMPCAADVRNALLSMLTNFQSFYAINYQILTTRK